MEDIKNPSQEILSARAWLRDDGMVIYSEEGTRLQNRILRRD